MKIKAAVLFELNKPLEIIEIESENLKEGQVLVKNLFSGVCRSQLMEVKGGRGDDKWLPHLLGHEGAGVVIGIGKGVTKVKVGSEVILSWIKGEGLDAEPAKYYYGTQKLNSGKVTTFSNYTIVSENRVYLKPRTLSFDAAVLYGCAIPTGAGMVLNELKPEENKSVIVVGLGGIGISAIMALKSSKVNKIIAIDQDRKKLEFVERLGIKLTFLSDEDNLKERISSITNGGADYCIESGGTVKSIELAFSFIKKNGGKLLFASHPPSGEKIRIDPFDLISGKHIFGSWGGSSKPDDDVIKIHNLFEESKIEVEDLISKRYLLEDINNALYDLEMGEVFRPLIEMEHI